MAEQSKPFDPFQHKPDISESSRKLYLFNLSKLNDGKPIKDLKFLKKESIVPKIENLKPNTRRTYLISMVSALRGRPESLYKKLYEKFYDLLMSLNKELKDNTEKSEKVKDNWMDQTTILERQKELSAVLDDISGKRKLTEGEYNQLLNLVVLSIYTLQQPRRNRDYTEMRVVRKVNPDASKNQNYLDVGSWNWIFNAYKTQKKYSQQVIPVPDELKAILQVYLKFHPRSKLMKKGGMDEPFLVRYDGTPISTSPEMTRLLNKVFGKRIGCSMLRSIFLTHKYGDTIKELKNDVAQMGTSSDTAQNNYIKQE